MAIFLLLFSVFHFGLCNEVFIIAQGGASCPQDKDCTTLFEILKNPEQSFTSNTVLNFLQGTHILQQDSPVLINGVSNLTLKGTGEIEEGFHWTVKQSNVFIKCTNSTGGFVVNGSSISIQMITVTDCGTTMHGSSIEQRLLAYKEGLYSAEYNVSVYSQLGASLFFIDSPSVDMEHFSVQNCSGSCIFFFNPESVVMNNVSIAHSSPDQFHSLRCCNATVGERPACTGGNIIFFYVDSADCNRHDNFTLSIKDSAFSFGAGSGTTGTTILAGITIFDLIVAWLSATFESVLLFDNAGGNLGVISSYSQFSMSKVTSYGANKYLLETCPLASVGIAFKFSASNEIMCSPIFTNGDTANHTQSTVNIYDSMFEDNFAINSAGINVDISFVVESSINSFLSFVVQDSEFIRNHAPFASCIGSGGFVGFPARLDVQFINLSMTYNDFFKPRNTAYNGFPPSCIAFANNQPAMLKDITIVDQQLVGIFGISTTLIFFGSNVIKNSTSNENGGGIAVEANCRILFGLNAKIDFIDNKAQRGAGIYIFQPRVIALIQQLCIFQTESDPDNSVSVMYFRGNKANVTGDVIYGGNLGSCLLFNQQTLTPIREILSNLFVQTENDSFPHYAFSSNAERLCLCRNGLPICHKTVITTSALFPGQTVNVSVATIGQLDGFTTGSVLTKANLLNYSYVSTFQNQIAGCFNMTLPIHFEGIEMLAPSFLFANLTVTFEITLNPSQELETDVNVTVFAPVKKCPAGFSVNDSFICQCDPVIGEYISNVTCDINSNSISHNSGVWIGFDNSTNNTIVSKSCPFDYCIHGRVTFGIFDEEKQCAFHRSGVLCGKCADGYSLLLGTNECGECPNDNFLSLLLVFGVAGILLVVFLIGLNLTVSVGTINGLIFYANIVQINQNIFYPDGGVDLLSQFISLINLDFGFETCFYKGMTPYAKVWLQYIFPVYIWVIVLIIIVFSRYSRRLSRLVGSNAVPVLATLMFLSYSKLVRTFVLALRLSDLKFSNGNVGRVWTVDGSLEYAGTKHIVLCVFSLLVFVIVLVPFTCFVTFVPLLHHKISSYCPNLWLRFLKPVSDAFSGPFTHSQRYWVGLGLVARLIIAVSVPLLDDTNSLFVVFYVVMFLVSWFAISGGVFRHKLINALEIWSFANLLGMTVLALGGFSLIGTIVSVSLMFSTFLLIVVTHLGWRIRNLVFKPSSTAFLRSSDEDKQIQSHGKMFTEMTESLEDNTLTAYREPLLDHLNLSTDGQEKLT